MGIHVGCPWLRNLFIESLFRKYSPPIPVSPIPFLPIIYTPSTPRPITVYPGAFPHPLPPLTSKILTFLVGYRGECPFQAKESDLMSHYIHTTLPKRGVIPIGYVDFHSYSQEILYPFAYDCDVLPRDAEDLAEAAWGCAKAARNVHGRYFDVDSACEGDNFQSKVFDPCSLSLSLSASVFFVRCFLFLPLFFFSSLPPYPSSSLQVTDFRLALLMVARQ